MAFLLHPTLSLPPPRNPRQARRPSPKRLTPTASPSCLCPTLQIHSGTGQKTADTFAGQRRHQGPRAYGALAAPGLLVFADDSGHLPSHALGWRLPASALPATPTTWSGNSPATARQAPGSRPSDPDGSLLGTRREAKTPATTSPCSPNLRSLTALARTVSLRLHALTCHGIRRNPPPRRGCRGMARSWPRPAARAGFGYDPLF